MSRRQRHNLTREQREALEKLRAQAAKEQNEKEEERKKRLRAALYTTNNEYTHNKTTNGSGNDKEGSHSNKYPPQKKKKKKKSSTSDSITSLLESLESRGDKQESKSLAESPHEKKSSTFAFSSARRISEGTNYLGTTLASPASYDASSRPFHWSFRQGGEEDSKNDNSNDNTNDNKRVSNSPAAKFSQDSSQDSAPRLVQVTQPRSNSGVKEATLVVTAKRSWHNCRPEESSSEESDSDDEIPTKESQPVSPRIGTGKNKPNSASKALSSRSEESEDESISRKTRAAPKKNGANADSDSSSDEDEEKPTKARSRPKPIAEESRFSQDSPGGIDAYVGSSPEQERPKKKRKVSGPAARDSLSLPRNSHAVEERQKQRDLDSARTPISPQDKAKEDSLWDDDDDEPVITSRAQRRRSAPRNAVGDTGRRSNNQNHQRHAHDPKNQPAPEVVQQQHSPQAINCENDDNVAYSSEDDESDFDEDGKHNLHPDFGEGPTFGPFELVPLKLENAKTGDSHEVPASLSRYLPGFQREGIKFLYNAISNKKGAIMGDDMGLGKTCQVISLLSAFLGKKGSSVDKRALRKRRKEVQAFRPELESSFSKYCLGEADFKSEEELTEEFKTDKLELPEKVPILLVVPSSVVDNWHFEFSLWGHFSVAVYRDKEMETALEAVKYGSAEVLLCGHSMFGAAAHFREIIKMPFKLVIVDEFHVFKTPKSNLSKNLKMLIRKHPLQVLGLTGTPMQNRLEELHNLIDLVAPGVLGDLKSFTKNVAEKIKLSRTANATTEAQEVGERKRKELNEILQPLYIQRKKTDVLQNMKVKVEKVHFCQLAPLQAELYEHILDLPDYELVRGANAPCGCGVNRNYFAEYLRLRSRAEKVDYQRKHPFVRRAACCHRYPKEGEQTVLWDYQHKKDGGEPCKRCPSCVLLPALAKLYQLSASALLIQYDESGTHEDKEKREAFSKIALGRFLPRLPGGTYRRCITGMRTKDHFAMSGKMVKLHELLKNIQGGGGRVLLFSYSVQVLDFIESYLTLETLSFLRIDGGTPSRERQGLVNQFQKSDDIFCFLLSTRAAGVGLNLTAANHVIIFDCEWNPALDEQAQDRSYRIGQRRDVTVHRLVAQGTIDEMKYLRQVYKVHLKQETFRAAEGSDALAPPRAFVGVEKDKYRKGELFGVENLLKFEKDSRFVDKVFKQRKPEHGDPINSDELAVAWGKGEDILEQENEALVVKEIERIIGEQGADESNGVLVEPTACGAREYETKEDEAQEDDNLDDSFEHKHFFQRKLKPAYDDNTFMGGQSQMVDVFVGKGAEPGPEIEEIFEEEDSSSPKPELVSTPNKTNGPSLHSAYNPQDDESGDDSDDSQDLDTRSKDKAAIASRKSKPRPEWAATMIARGNNFELCGVSGKEIRTTRTTFSKADFYQPEKKSHRVKKQKSA